MNSHIYIHTRIYTLQIYLTYMYIHIHVCICRDTGTYIDHINDAVLHKHLPIRTPRSCVEFPKFSSTLILYSKYQL